MSDTDLLIGAMLITAVMIGVGLYRVFAGPTVFDRLVAVALLSVNGVILLVFIGFTFDRASLFLDIALAFALLAFLLPIALGRYFEDRDDGTSSDGAPSARSRPRPLGVIPHGLFAERGRRLQEQEAKRRAVGTSPMRDRSDAQPGYPEPSTGSSNAARDVSDSGAAPTDRRGAPGPTNPGPTNLGPTNPGPTNPGPTNPGPTNPGPTNPGPRDPGGGA